MSDNTPGWQPDPTGKHDHRYWDGSQWTDNVSDAGVASTDAYEAPADDAPTVADTPVVAAAAEPAPPAPVDPTVATPVPPAPDATAAWPTSPAAPAPPAAPPPYVSTSPVSAGGGGSKKGLLVGGGILAAIAIAVVAFLALGGDDDESNVRTQLASALQRESDLSDSDAECVADFFVDDLGEDAFEGVDFSSSDPPEELQEAFLESGVKAVEECDLDAEALGGTDGATDEGATDEGATDEATDDGATDGDAEEGTYGSDPTLDALYDECEAGDYASCDKLYNDSPSGSEYEEFADSCGERNEPQGYCVDIYEDGGDTDGLTDGLTDIGGDLPEGFEDTLADTYEQSLNLSREKAECLASVLSEAIQDGSINQEEVMSDFFDYLEECDISMEEISGG